MTEPLDPLPGLLAATARGERDAFARLYRLTAAHLFALARRILGNEERAQDCLQDAFVQIWQRACDYEAGKGTPMTWMSSIVRYRALDRLRTARHGGATDEAVDLDALPDGGPGPSEQVLQGEDAQALSRCLGELKEQQRRVILLAYYEGLTHEDLARRMDAPLGTVKTWIRRGLQQIKQCLQR